MNDPISLIKASPNGAKALELLKLGVLDLDGAVAMAMSRPATTALNKGFMGMMSSGLSAARGFGSSMASTGSSFGTSLARVGGRTGRAMGAVGRIGRTGWKRSGAIGMGLAALSGAATGYGAYRQMQQQRQSSGYGVASTRAYRQRSQY
jgi:hypothetical protein